MFHKKSIKPCPEIEMKCDKIRGFAGRKYHLLCYRILNFSSVLSGALTMYLLMSLAFVKPFKF